MVLRVALRTLQNEHDAEDVFQATFLVLSQKAHALRRQESLGSWLYGIAYRLALKARAKAGRRRVREQRVAATPVTTPLAQMTVEEAQTILDEELSRLPEKLREPVVLCCLEGLTRDEAAHQIGCQASVLKSRLEQARERLRHRLVARGLTLSSGLGAMLLSEGAAGAALPPALIGATTKAAIAVAAGRAANLVVTAKVVALTEGMLRTMFLNKIGASALFAAIACGIGFGTFALSLSEGAANNPPGTVDPSGAPKTGATNKQVVAAYDKPPATVDPKEAPKAKDTKQKELLKERLTVVREIAKLAKDRLQIDPAASFNEVRVATNMVLQAELELCDSEKDRIAVLEKFAVAAKEWEEVVIRLNKAGQAWAIEPLKAKADRLQAEIALDKAKSKLPVP